MRVCTYAQMHSYLPRVAVNTFILVPGCLFTAHLPAQQSLHSHNNRRCKQDSLHGSLALAFLCAPRPGIITANITLQVRQWLGACAIHRGVHLSAEQPV